MDAFKVNIPYLKGYLMNKKILLGLLLVPCVAHAMEEESQIIKSTLNNSITYIRFAPNFMERAQYDRRTRAYTSSRCITADTPIELFKTLKKAYKEQEAYEEQQKNRVELIESDGVIIYRRGDQDSENYICVVDYKDEEMRKRGCRYLVEESITARFHAEEPAELRTLRKTYEKQQMQDVPEEEQK